MPMSRRGSFKALKKKALDDIEMKQDEYEKLKKEKKALEQ